MEAIHTRKEEGACASPGTVVTSPALRCMGSAIVFYDDIGAVGVGVGGGGGDGDGDGDGDGPRCGEVREFVTRRSSCMKRRNIAVLRPCPFETGAGQGKDVLLVAGWQAGCNVPIQMPGARILPRDPADGAVWVITDCQLHRSVTSSPKHSNVKCQMPGRQGITAARMPGAPLSRTPPDSVALEPPSPRLQHMQ